MGKNGIKNGEKGHKTAGKRRKIGEMREMRKTGKPEKWENGKHGKIRDMR